MKTTNEINPWGIHSVSFWMTMLIALGIIFVGARFIINPAAGAAGFGVPISSGADLPYGRIKGIRDIFSGLVLLPLLLQRMRRATAWAFTTAIIIPATDCLIVLTTNGPTDMQHILIHGLTVIYMTITSFLLFKKQPR